MAQGFRMLHRREWPRLQEFEPWNAAAAYCVEWQQEQRPRLKRMPTSLSLADASTETI
jgi:hypothetical protein